MFGRLHMGLAAMKTAENVIESSWWTGELVIISFLVFNVLDVKSPG